MSDRPTVLGLDGFRRPMTDDEYTQHQADQETWENRPPPRRYVPKFLIQRRLEDAGLFDEAMAAFDQLPRPLQERWRNNVDIWSEDPDTVALLTAIGADPDVILAEG